MFYFPIFFTSFSRKISFFFVQFLLEISVSISKHFRNEKKKTATSENLHNVSFPKQNKMSQNMLENKICSLTREKIIYFLKISLGTEIISIANPPFNYKCEREIPFAVSKYFFEFCLWCFVMYWLLSSLGK